MTWGYGVPSLVIYNLFLKFGSKRSTLKFWFFGPRAQFLAYSALELKITLESNSNGFLQFFRLIWAPLEKWTKPRNHFENGRFWFFSEFFVKTQFLQKSRQSSSDTVEKAAIKSIRDIKSWNCSKKPWPSPSSVNLLPSQTDDIEFRFSVVLESFFSENFSG